MGLICINQYLNYEFYFLDSLYFACSGSSIDDIVLDRMKERYNQALYHRCFRKPDGSIDTDIEIATDDGFHWFPRKCCSQHNLMDK